MKETHSKNNLCAVVARELLKVLDCLKNVLLIDKLHAFGFNNKTGRVICTYRCNRVKVKKVYQDLSIYLKCIQLPEIEADLKCVLKKFLANYSI